VVAAWIRTAGVSDDFQNCYAFLASLVRRWREVGMRLLVLVLTRVLKDQQRVLLAVDDSPTKRYAPQVQGAGFHHDPPPGPSSGGAFCYGHVWVTLAAGDGEAPRQRSPPTLQAFPTGASYGAPPPHYPY
jgi:hypothetical protein